MRADARDSWIANAALLLALGSFGAGLLARLLTPDSRQQRALLLGSVFWILAALATSCWAAVRPGAQRSRARVALGVTTGSLALVAVFMPRGHGPSWPPGHPQRDPLGTLAEAVVAGAAFGEQVQHGVRLSQARSAGNRHATRPVELVAALGPARTYRVLAPSAVTRSYWQRSGQALVSESCGRLGQKTRLHPSRVLGPELDRAWR